MIAIIAAVAKNRVIGKDGRIPWHIPADMEHFKKLTLGNVVIMGRRTYEEIGRPLSGRMTYLVSQTLRVEAENCHTAASLSEALQAAGERDVFICGGAMLYEEALPIADCLYLTELEREVDGDTFFPAIDKDLFECVGREEVEKGIYFCLYKRTNA